jgi:hypothetical protein
LKIFNDTEHLKERDMAEKTPPHFKIDEKNYVEEPLLNQLK